MRPTTTRFIAALMASTPLLCIGGVHYASRAQSPPPVSEGVDTPFPDFGYMLPPDQYKGPVFRLSQDYPVRHPDIATLPPFFKTDFQKDWRKYMQEARDYCFEGNTDVDWRVEKNPLRKWYHMPWIHSGPFGREGVHGLNMEAPVAVKQLASSQDYPNAVAYAIGIYNDFGGYTIGRVWKNHREPNLKVMTASDMEEKSMHKGFAEGTVMCKLLFVSLPADTVSRQVPSLVNPIQWDAYIPSKFLGTDRTIQKVTLIQMDLMARDKRAPTGWVSAPFSTTAR